MNTELRMLIWSVILGIFQVLLATSAATKQRGIKWNISSRGQEFPALTGVAGRLSRAADNFKETFPFFLASVVIIQLLAKNSSVTALGAQLYFGCRLLYVPIYAFDITHVRTIVWSGATLGIILVLSAAC